MSEEAIRELGEMYAEIAATQAVDFAFLSLLLRSAPNGREIFDRARDQIAEMAASGSYRPTVADGMAERLGEYARVLDA